LTLSTSGNFRLPVFLLTRTLTKDCPPAKRILHGSHRNLSCPASAPIAGTGAVLPSNWAPPVDRKSVPTLGLGAL